MLRFLKFRQQPKKNEKRKARAQASKKVKQEQSLDIQLNGRYVMAALLFVALTALVALLPKTEWLPIEKIRISGQFKELDTTRLEQQLKPYLGAGFFSVDIQQIQQLVSTQPWIQSVSVRRIWPDQIMVSVVEKKAYARWDDEHLLSTQAAIFKAETGKFKHLPLLNGYEGQSEAVLKRYLQISKIFGDRDINVSEYREDSKGALTLLLDGQLKVSLGSDNNQQKIEHMLAVYPQQIKPRSDQIQHIDFRYSNGFAIAWKQGVLQQQESQLGSMQRGNKNV